MTIQLMQKYTSANTSVNTLTRVYKQVNFPSGAEVLDYGGGRYDTNTKYLKNQGVSCYIYDPYNRSVEHNKAILTHFCDGAEFIVCANVLNVIKEDSVIIMVLAHIRGLLKEHGELYIQIYEGDKSGVGRVTTKGYQRNQRTKEYKDIIQQVFDWDLKLKGNIIKLNRVV